MKRILAAGLCFVLGGCTTELAKLQQVYVVATTATVPERDAQIAVSSFEVLEAGATAYFKYCKTSAGDSRCAAGTKQSPGPLRLAIKYDREGIAARDQIKSAAKTGQLISSVVYNLLISAVNGLASTPAASFGAAK